MPSYDLKEDECGHKGIWVSTEVYIMEWANNNVM